MIMEDLIGHAVTCLDTWAELGCESPQENDEEE